MASEASPALNTMPAEILDLIFASLSPIHLWHLRRTSKRFNAILHPRLLDTLRAMADPLPLTLIRETTCVPLSFIYSLVLAVLGDEEGRKLWGRIFPSRDTSPETPYSSWLPATPPPPSSPSHLDQEPSPSAIRRQNETNAFPDLFIPHLRRSSLSLANLRRIHFWSILLWYKEWSFISSNPSPAEAGKARTTRLHWAYKQHRDNYESRPGDTPAVVDEFKRTYILRRHFDQPAPPRSGRDGAVLYVRSRRLLYFGASLP
ncbi:F-box domain-containing protein [Colletotrichum tofieldiae]|uniref:F-box domain-containing protein n=1 Tax=Colletotrichum tofieldiae TaxID=708197 RepID=A0A166X170_9PEZI|nr:F-box domain-containing protein [Colletotrichum tofieldiae]GKT90852.1 F-box domain-containing protein [Colletotrichum tofieldiae]